MTSVFPTSMVLRINLLPSAIQLPVNAIQPYRLTLGCDEAHAAA